MLLRPPPRHHLYFVYFVYSPRTLCTPPSASRLLRLILCFLCTPLTQFSLFSVASPRSARQPFARTNRSISNTLELTEGHPPTSVVVRRYHLPQCSSHRQNSSFCSSSSHQRFPQQARENAPREKISSSPFLI